MLLSDEEITLDIIIKEIIVPAYNCQKSHIEETIANVIGQLACIVSKSGSLVRYFE